MKMELIKITKTGIIVFTITLMLAFFGSVLAHAQDATSSGSQPSDTQLAQRYHISFPVGELGNCNSLSECKSYCDDVSHQTACMDFAKSHGFYKQTQTSSAALLDASRTALGCDSATACQQFCGQQQNWQKCGDFAKKYHIGNQGQNSNQTNTVLVQVASQFLGCTSFDSCRTFCSQLENRQKCSEFAKVLKVGSANGDQTSGPPANSQICKGLGERLATNSAVPAVAKLVYDKYCTGVTPEGSGSTRPLPIQVKPPVNGGLSTVIPQSTGITTSNLNRLPPLPASVRGIATQANFFQKILRFFGF